jgi:Mor family transcriptional regulator
MGNKKKSVAPLLLADLADQVADVVGRHGIVPPEAAAEIGIEVVDRMRLVWGGQPIYFDKGVAIDVSRRDIEMWERFNGQNHAELARAYNLSVIHVYRRIKTVGRAMRGERQGELFNQSGGEK